MDSIKKVVVILEKMILAHKQLLQLAVEKREVLVSGNIQELQSIILKESTCTEEIQKLENSRMDLVTQYMASLGNQAKMYTLEEFILLQDDLEVKERLTQFAKELRQLVQDITNHNHLNQELIHTSLAYIQYSMRTLLRKEPSIGYGPNSSSQYLSFLDAKV